MVEGSAGGAVNTPLRVYVEAKRAFGVARAFKAKTPTEKRRRRRRILALLRPVDAAFKALPQSLRARIRRREWWWMQTALKRLYSKAKIETLVWASPMFGLLPKVAP